MISVLVLESIPLLVREHNCLVGICVKVEAQKFDVLWPGLIKAYGDADEGVGIINAKWEMVWIHCREAMGKNELLPNVWDLSIYRDAPFWQNVDNLLAHYKRSVVQDTGRPHTVFGDRQLPVEEGFCEEE